MWSKSTNEEFSFKAYTQNSLNQPIGSSKLTIVLEDGEAAIQTYKALGKLLLAWQRILIPALEAEKDPHSSLSPPLAPSVDAPPSVCQDDIHA
jgi:hypothetical protein